MGQFLHAMREEDGIVCVCTLMYISWRGAGGGNDKHHLGSLINGVHQSAV